MPFSSADFTSSQLFRRTYNVKISLLVGTCDFIGKASDYQNLTVIR